MVSFNPANQRISSLSIKETLKYMNTRGLLVGSLLVGGGLVLANEFAVKSITNTIVLSTYQRPATHPQYTRATLVPKTKPDFVKRWEDKFGKKQE